MAPLGAYGGGKLIIKKKEFSAGQDQLLQTFLSSEILQLMGVIRKVTLAAIFSVIITVFVPDSSRIAKATL